MDEKCEPVEYRECAVISTKRMYRMLLEVESLLLTNNRQHNEEIIRLLASLEHDILLLNDKDNSIMCDLYE